MIADRYPPPGVWSQVDDAARNAEELWSAHRELDFRASDSGRVEVTLVEDGKPVRPVTLLEALAVAAGAPR